MSMKHLIETFKGNLITDEDEQRICLTRKTFDRIMTQLSGEYSQYQEEMLLEGTECITFDRWLKITNSWQKAMKAQLGK